MNTTRKSRSGKTFTPAAWQWDPMQLRCTGMIQFWTPEGSCSLITPSEARKLVQACVAFVGSEMHVNQAHDGIAR